MAPIRALPILALASSLALGAWTQWALKRTAPRDTNGAAVAVVNGRLVTVGGAAGTQVYNVASDRWSQGPTLPVPLAHGAFAQTRQGIDVYGGQDGQGISRAIWKLDTSERFAWSEGGRAPADTLHGRAARVGEKTYLFGGCSHLTDWDRCSDKVWMRVRNSVWRQVSLLPQGRIAMAASAVAGDKVYFFGGVTTAGDRADAFVFNTSVNEWRKLASLPSARRGAGAAASPEGRLFVIGGTSGETALDSVLAYDPATDRYTAGPPLPQPAAAAEFARNGDLLAGIAGGRTLVLR